MSSGLKAPRLGRLSHDPPLEKATARLRAGLRRDEFAGNVHQRPRCARP
jgi:hypothetical protein